MGVKNKKESKGEIKNLEKQLNYLEWKPIEPLWNKKFLKDKKGNKLTLKEYISKWKEGMEGINTKQQLNIQIKSTKIILVGIVAGFIITLTEIENFWWLTLILAGAFGNTFVQYLSLTQRRKQIKEFEQIPIGNIGDYLNKINEGGNKNV